MNRDYGALIAFLASRRAMPFEWGSAANDCVSFCGQAIEAMAGRNPFGDLHWGDEDEAYRVINSVDGLGTGVSARLPEIAPAMAQRGDVGGVMLNNHLFLAIVEGLTLIGPGPRGTRRLPRKMMERAWSAG